MFLAGALRGHGLASAARGARLGLSVRPVLGGSWFRTLTDARNLSPTADELFHLLAGLEGHDLLGLDVHSRPGPRVARLAGLAHLHLEHAEVAQLDPPHLD